MNVYTPTISIKRLCDALHEELQPKIIEGQEYTKRLIVQPAVHKAGLALAGQTKYVRHQGIQLFGRTELTYLRSLDPEVRKSGLDTFFKIKPVALVLCSNQRCPTYLRAYSRQHQFPVIRSTLPAARVQPLLANFLNYELSPRATMHASLMDVFGVGILLTGKSGVGKSECALDLIMRGHPLVADDIVELRRKGQDIMGRSPELVRNHLEIRGLGIVNVRDLYGVISVRERKTVDLVIELIEWSQGNEFDRTGIEELNLDILGASLPHLIIPVRPGRNLGTIVEVAARNELLKRIGIHTALALKQRLDQMLSGAMNIAEGMS